MPSSGFHLLWRVPRRPLSLEEVEGPGYDMMVREEKAMKAGGRIGSRTKTATIALGLLILNIALVFPGFTGEYTQYLGSIESGYISGTR